MDDERQPIIIAAKRTAIGRAYGMFSDIYAEHLLSAVLVDLAKCNNLNTTEIDDIIIGNAAGGGGNIARLAALTAGFDIQIPGLTIDRQCGSGLEAINLACRLIASGAGQAYLAGGVESVSTAPQRARRTNKSGDQLEFYDRAQFAPHEIGDPDMGEAAENVARKYGISRQRQDEFALQSHQRAVKAQMFGKFQDEITAVEFDGRILDKDECPRDDTCLEKLASLPSKFEIGGTVTAGNSCPLNDGAAVVLIASLANAKRWGVKRAIQFLDASTRGVDPNYLGVGPIASTRYLFNRNPEITVDDLQFIEFNEAFASQVLASLDALDISSDRVNLDGGALALGHPFGASGAILVTRLLSQMLDEANFKENAVSLATLGTAGGMGVSTLFWAIEVSK